MRRSLPAVLAPFLVAAGLLQFALPERPALAQGSEAASGTVDLRAWDTSNLYDGWSGEALLGEPVYGTGGQVLGEISDLVIAADGSMQRVVVDGGGLVDRDAARVAVPWNAVKRVGSAGIDVPVAQGNLDGHGLYPEVGEAALPDSSFRLREMIGDRVTADGAVFGSIRDVIFDRYDRIAAIIVVPGAGSAAPGGPIAFPYNPDYFEKQASSYASPYPREALRELRPFDYGSLD